MQGECYFLLVLDGCQLDNFLDDIAGIFVAGELNKMCQEDVFNDGFVFFGVAYDVLHHIVAVLAL